MKLTTLIRISMGAAFLSISGAAQAQALTDGWTTLTPSPDSRLIYVSSSAGNDANNGLSPSTPKRTLASAYGLVRSGYPDHMLLKKGDTFYEGISWTKSGRSTAEKAVLGSYGAGARPMLLTGSTTAVNMFGGSLNHVAVVGLAMRADTWSGQLPPGDDPPGLVAIAPGDDLLIEDCYIESYANSLIVQGYPTVRTNTKIRRNVLVDPLRLDPNNGSVCIFMAEYDGVLIEENLFDNSRSHEANQGAMLSHCIYMGEGSTSNNIIRNNIAHNGGRTNFNCRTGGLIENNLSIRGAQGITAGVSYAEEYVTATVRNNVITESRNNQNGQELGFGMSFDKIQTLDIDGNLICNSSDGTNAMAITMTSAVRAGQIRNNLVYRWQGPSQPSWGVETINIGGTPEGPIAVTNNQLQQPGNAHLVTFGTSGSPPVGLVTLAGNRYFSGRSGGLWFLSHYGFDATFSQWTSLTGESGSQATQIGYNDPGRSIASYHATLGRPASTASFLAWARLQSKDNWRPEYTAASVNAYMRAGYDMGSPTGCRPDMNVDGQLNVTDFTAFLQAYAARQGPADFNQDGYFNISDFTAFLQGYAAGCH
jgi:hypothetical protein